MTPLRRFSRPPVWVAVSVLALAVIFPSTGKVSFAQSSPQDDLAAAAAGEHSAHYEAAVRHYRNFLDVAGSSAAPAAVVEVRTRLATALFMLHRYDESLAALQPLMPPDGKVSPDKTGPAGSHGTRSTVAISAQAWLVRGLDELQLSRPGDVSHLSDAVQHLRRSLELKPESGTARLALGDALARSQHLEEAADEYREQLRRTPELADAWYKLGLVYTNLAGKVATEFVREQPGNRLAILLSAERLYDGGNYWGAAQALFPVVRSSGSNPGSTNHSQDSQAAQVPGTPDRFDLPPGLHAAFGAALLQLGYSRAAEGEFNAELARDPLSLPAQFGMAEVEWLRSDEAAALGTLEHLMAAYPKEVAGQLESHPPAALSRVSQNDAKLPDDPALSAAQRLWTEWLGSASLESPPRLSSNGVQCSEQPSSLQLQPGYWINEECAAELLKDLRSQRNPTPSERAKLIETQYRLGDYEGARTSALELLRLTGGDPWGPYWLSRSYSALAAESFDKLAKVSPDSVRVHEILARYHSERQQLAAARTEYEAALRFEPNLPDLHVGLGTVYWQSGDWTHAQTELKKALELSPGSATAAYELGDSYLQQRQWQQAADYLRGALSDPATERKARLDLAKALDELGKRNDAIQELTLLAKDDADGEIHYRLAMAYREIGDTANAQAALAASEALRRASDRLSAEQLESMQREANGAESAAAKQK